MLEFKEVKLEEFVNGVGGGANLEVRFKDALKTYLDSINRYGKESERARVSNRLKPFFDTLGFVAQSETSSSNANSNIDLALMQDDKVRVLIEAKASKNKIEMFSPSNVNCKALHEAILYYFRERENNNYPSFIIICDFYTFYIFRANMFETLFFKNPHFENFYKNFTSPNSLFKDINTGNVKTQRFYEEAKCIIENKAYLDSIKDCALEGCVADFMGLDSSNLDSLDSKLNLENLAKLFSKEFLLNLPRTIDANELNKEFYDELLHILGLREISQNGSILIIIDKEKRASFALHILHKLEHSSQEVAMRLIILWLNRILFLKLIEARLIEFNDENLAFLTYQKIDGFHTLAHLFFEVLAKPKEQRESNKGFNHLPYLNSSLFVRDEIEEKYLEINTLDNDLTIEYFSRTKIKENNKKASGEVRFLAYLFAFLSAWDFAKIKGENKANLISSSVLGLVFEKLNGYKEGSFYTPNFITSYMCKQALHKVVVEKFNTAFNWSAQNLNDVRANIDRNFNAENKQKFIKLLESIRICDPAVGSGHFLVSALNEMIYIYYSLGLLGFRCKLSEPINDEIMITNGDGKEFIYKRPNIENDINHIIQKGLFELKRNIIENNLFGVDINENSVNICRLRLWIELLKNSYYKSMKSKSELENLTPANDFHDLNTLPNIDINIKCGNSLISRFDMQDSLNHIRNIREQIRIYKDLVQDYKTGNTFRLKPINKADLDSQINNIIESFTITLKNPKLKAELESLIEEHIKNFGTFMLDDESLLKGLTIQRSLFSKEELNEKSKKPPQYPLVKSS